MQPSYPFYEPCDFASKTLYWDRQIWLVLVKALTLMIVELAFEILKRNY